MKKGRTARVAVIGIGSPFGDDAAGLEVARRLAREKLAGVDVIAADRPGLALVELLDGREAVILIDAARTPRGRAGTLYEMDLRGVTSDRPAPVSSHAVGVAEALALAARLGRLPAHARLIAIDIGRRGRSTAGFSPAVERAIGRVVARVEREISSDPLPCATTAAPVDGRRGKHG